MSTSQSNSTPVKSDLAILIADISNSIGLYEELGDIEAYSRIKECQDLFSRTTEKNNGRVYRKYGDVVLCGFSTADDAATAAIGMQEGLKQAVKDSDVEIAVHIGLYYGETMTNGSEIYGDAVNAAGRIADLAEANQIFTSRSTVDLLSPGTGTSSVYIDRVSIKGKKEELEIYELIKDNNYSL